MLITFSECLWLTFSPALPRCVLSFPHSSWQVISALAKDGGTGCSDRWTECMSRHYKDCKQKGPLLFPTRFTLLTPRTTQRPEDTTLLTTMLLLSSPAQNALLCPLCPWTPTLFSRLNANETALVSLVPLAELSSPCPPLTRPPEKKKAASSLAGASCFITILSSFISFFKCVCRSPLQDKEWTCSSLYFQ